MYVVDTNFVKCIRGVVVVLARIKNEFIADLSIDDRVAQFRQYCLICQVNVKVFRFAADNGDSRIGIYFPEVYSNNELFVGHPVGNLKSSVMSPEFVNFFKDFFITYRMNRLVYF